MYILYIYIYIYIYIIYIYIYIYIYNKTYKKPTLPQNFGFSTLRFAPFNYVRCVKILYCSIFDPNQKPSLQAMRQIYLSCAVLQCM